jgi:hypothetical protein
LGEQDAGVGPVGHRSGVGPVELIHVRQCHGIGVFSQNVASFFGHSFFRSLISINDEDGDDDDYDDNDDDDDDRHSDRCRIPMTKKKKKRTLVLQIVPRHAPVFFLHSDASRMHGPPSNVFARIHRLGFTASSNYQPMFADARGAPFWSRFC